MNGRDLALGLVAGVAVAGVVAQRSRGSRATRWPPPIPRDPDKISRSIYRWTSGGCLDFAQALNERYGYPLVVITPAYNLHYAIHVVGAVPGGYIDALGFRTEAELRKAYAGFLAFDAKNDRKEGYDIPPEQETLLFRQLPLSEIEDIMDTEVRPDPTHLEPGTVLDVDKAAAVIAANPERYERQATTKPARVGFSRFLKPGGSRNEENITLSRGVLRIPGEAPIRLKKLGAGAFATAYVTTDGSPPAVYVVTPDDVYDKELLAMARDAEPNNPHLPKVERVGETRDQTIYRMPLYRTPLKKAHSPSGWKDYAILKKCREDAYEHWDARRMAGKRGYQINEETVACAEEAGVSPSTLDALRILVDTAANYGDDYVFEFSPRNLATDDAGNLVLLDPLFDREKLQANRQKERRKREAMERSRFGVRW